MVSLLEFIQQQQKRKANVRAKHLDTTRAQRAKIQKKREALAFSKLKPAEDWRDTWNPRDSSRRLKKLLFSEKL